MVRRIPGILVECEPTFQRYLRQLEKSQKLSFILEVIDDRHFVVSETFELDKVSIDTMPYLSREIESMVAASWRMPKRL